MSSRYDLSRLPELRHAQSASSSALLAQREALTLTLTLALTLALTLTQVALLDGKCVGVLATRHLRPGEQLLEEAPLLRLVPDGRGR